MLHPHLTPHFPSTTDLVLYMAAICLGVTIAWMNSQQAMTPAPQENMYASMRQAALQFERIAIMEQSQGLF